MFTKCLWFLLTFALLGPSTDKDNKGPEAFLVEMVKVQGSPHLPAVKPGPYAVKPPLDSESTWNLYGDPNEMWSNSIVLIIWAFGF